MVTQMHVSHTCVCVYMCVHVYVSMCICVHVCMHVHAWVCTRVYMHVCACVCVCARNAYVCVCVCTMHVCVRWGGRWGEGERRLRGVCLRDRELHHHLPGWEVDS